MSGPAVLLLCAPISPAAIVRAVGAVGVDAVEREAGRTLAHVGDERRVVVDPSVADVDASAAVVFPFFHLGIAAPLLHSTPDPIQTLASAAVRRVSSRKHAGDGTTAGYGVSGSQMIRQDRSGSAANATAKPFYLDALPLGILAQDGKTAELLASQIKFPHPKIVRKNAGGRNAC